MAYILPIDAAAEGLNANKRVPFKRNAGIGLTGSPFDQGNLQLKGTDKPEFWAYSVVLAYQPGLGDDGDPDTEEPLLGFNPDDYALTTAKGFCVVWLEAVRDKEWSLNQSQIQEGGFSDNRAPTYEQAYLGRLYGVIAHEIGHAPGTGITSVLDHSEQGLMAKGAARVREEIFTAQTVDRFRSASKWTP